MSFEAHDTPAAARIPVPFLDLAPAHEPLSERLLADLAALIETGAFTNGPQVEEFERAFADFCGTAWCVGVASGLDALRLALLAAGLEAGGEVIVPANTFVATLEAVTQAGGRPVIVDVAEADLNMDPAAAAAAVSDATHAVVPVHLYGQMADMRAILEVAAHWGLPVIEDACQAHGAARDDLSAGSCGVAGCFSFYPAKNLGAFGDAGAMVTDDEGLASRVGALREHGQRHKYRHEVEGYTARLDTIQAVVLLRKLPRLADWNTQRTLIAHRYAEQLAGVGDLVLPAVPDGSDPVWHLYVVRSRRRDELAAFLGEQGIATGLHYPTPVHLAPAYAWLGYKRGDFPVAEKLSAEVLSLPVYPGMSGEQVDTVAASVRDFFETR